MSFNAYYIVKCNEPYTGHLHSALHVFHCFSGAFTCSSSGDLFILFKELDFPQIFSCVCEGKCNSLMATCANVDLTS